MNALFVDWIRGRRLGVSLIVVLLIAMAGMTMLGTIVYILNVSSGSSRVSSRQTEEYNILQKAVEQGKAILRDRMGNSDPPPRWTDKYGGEADITDSDTLLIENGIVVSSNVRVLGQGTAALEVRVFDMQYNPERVRISDDHELSLLPPSITLEAPSEWWSPDVLEPGSENADSSGTANNAGVYLIRATLTFPDGETKTIDTAVVQSNGATS